MLFIFRLLAFPVTGPVNGMRFILEQIREQALAEMMSEQQIESLLIETSLRHQAGEISDEEYEEIELHLIQELNTIRSLERSAEDDASVYEAYYEYEAEYEEPDEGHDEPS